MQAVGPSVNVSLRMLEMVALLFPVIIVIVQMSLRFAGRDREREIGNAFKYGLFAMGIAILYLFALSTTLISNLESELTSGAFDLSINNSRALFYALFVGTGLLIWDSYQEVLARYEAANREAEEKPNTVQTQLDDVEKDE